MRDVCSFCGKRRDQVLSAVAGPDALICDECVALCVDILDEQAPSGWGGAHGPRTGAGRLAT